MYGGIASRSFSLLLIKHILVFLKWTCVSFVQKKDLKKKKDKTKDTEKL